MTEAERLERSDETSVREVDGTWVDVHRSRAPAEKETREEKTYGVEGAAWELGIACGDSLVWCEGLG